MKSKIPLCLALVLSGGLLACSTIAGESHVGNTDEYQWGEAVDGFQMATSLDETNGILHCWIRNATTNEMDYPSSHFGYCEFTHLEVQAATNWVSIGLPLGAHTIRGFLPYLVGRIKPGQIITNTSYPQELAAWPVRSSNTLPDIRLVALRDHHGDTNKVFLAEERYIRFVARQVRASTLCLKDTFAFELLCCDFSANLTNGPSLKTRVTQRFQVKGEQPGQFKELTLYSPVFTLDTSMAQAWRKQGDLIYQVPP